MTMIAALPEWMCFIATLVFVLLSYEAGYRFGTRRRLKPGENPETAAGTLSGTTLGLLAFMLAFTFNGAASNHDVRKGLIIDEANAIRTAYQQSAALPDPCRAEVRGLLREYVDIRVKAPGLSPAGLEQAVARTMAIQEKLWSAALALQKNGSGEPMAGPFTQSLSRIFDLNVQRLSAAFQSRIPALVWVVLFLLTFITMAMIGYRIGLSGVRSNFVEIAMAMAFSSVLLLIIALDRPTGMLKVSQKPLVDVLGMIQKGRQEVQEHD